MKRSKTISKVKQFGSVMLFLVTIFTMVIALKECRLSSESITIQKIEKEKNRFMLSIIPIEDKKMTKFARPFELKRLDKKAFEVQKDKKR